MRYSQFLATLRAIDGMNEQRPGVFYRKSRAFLHFHEDPTGLHADLRTADHGDFVRTRVETKAEQSKLIETITSALATPVRK